jgi:hypothetical protein
MNAIWPLIMAVSSPYSTNLPSVEREVPPPALLAQAVINNVMTANRLKTLKEIFIRSSFGIDRVPDTSFQVAHQLLGGKLIGFCHILDGTKPLQQTANTVGIPLSEDRIGLWPFLQNIFHGHLGEGEICIHVTQNTTSHRILLCAGANRRESKKHAGMRAFTGQIKKAG